MGRENGRAALFGMSLLAEAPPSWPAGPAFPEISASKMAAGIFDGGSSSALWLPTRPQPFYYFEFGPACGSFVAISAGSDCG